MMTKKSEKTYTLEEARKVLDKKNPKNQTMLAEATQMGESVEIYKSDNGKGFNQTVITFSPFKSSDGGILTVKQWKNYGEQNVRHSTSIVIGHYINKRGEDKTIFKNIDDFVSRAFTKPCSEKWVEYIPTKKE